MVAGVGNVCLAGVGGVAFGRRAGAVGVLAEVWRLASGMCVWQACGGEACRLGWRGVASVGGGVVVCVGNVRLAGVGHDIGKVEIK